MAQDTKRGVRSWSLRDEVEEKLRLDAEREKKKQEREAKKRQEVEKVKTSNLIDQVPFLLNDKSTRGKSNNSSSSVSKNSAGSSGKSSEPKSSSASLEPFYDDIWDESPAVNPPLNDNTWDDVWDERKVETNKVNKEWKNEDHQNSWQTVQSKHQRHNQNSLASKRGNKTSEKSRKFKNSWSTQVNEQRKKDTTPIWDFPDRHFSTSGAVEAPPPVVNVWVKRLIHTEEVKAMEPTNETEEEFMIRQAIELSKAEAMKAEERRKKLEEEYQLQMELLQSNPEYFSEFREDTSNKSTPEVAIKCWDSTNYNRSTTEVTKDCWDNTDDEDKNSLWNEKKSTKASTLCTQKGNKAASYAGAKPKYNAIIDTFGGWGLKDTNFQKSGTKTPKYDQKSISNSHDAYKVEDDWDAEIINEYKSSSEEREWSDHTKNYNKKNSKAFGNEVFKNETLGSKIAKNNKTYEPCNSKLEDWDESGSEETEKQAFKESKACELESSEWDTLGNEKQKQHLKRKDSYNTFQSKDSEWQNSKTAICQSKDSEWDVAETDTYQPKVSEWDSSKIDTYQSKDSEWDSSKIDTYQSKNSEWDSSKISTYQSKDSEWDVTETETQTLKEKSNFGVYNLNVSGWDVAESQKVEKQCEGLHSKWDDTSGGGQYDTHILKEGDKIPNAEYIDRGNSFENNILIENKISEHGDKTDISETFYRHPFSEAKLKHEHNETTGKSVNISNNELGSNILNDSFFKSSNSSSVFDNFEQKISNTVAWNDQTSRILPGIHNINLEQNSSVISSKESLKAAKDISPIECVTSESFKGNESAFNLETVFLPSGNAVDYTKHLQKSDISSASELRSEQNSASDSFTGDMLNSQFKVPNISQPSSFGPTGTAPFLNPLGAHLMPLVGINPLLMQQMLLSNPFFITQLQAMDLYYRSQGIPTTAYPCYPPHAQIPSMHHMNNNSGNINSFAQNYTEAAEESYAHVSSASHVVDCPIPPPTNSIPTQEKKSTNSGPPGICASLVLPVNELYKDDSPLAKLGFGGDTIIPPPKPPVLQSEVSVSHTEVSCPNALDNKESSLSSFGSRATNIIPNQKHQINDSLNENIFFSNLKNFKVPPRENVPDYEVKSSVSGSFGICGSVVSPIDEPVCGALQGASQSPNIISPSNNNEFRPCETQTSLQSSKIEHVSWSDSENEDEPLGKNKYWEEDTAEWESESYPVQSMRDAIRYDLKKSTNRQPASQPSFSVKKRNMLQK
ncbi:uncharacterized protein LOC118181953 [Stegodyphus dumicola]|uniref:uncharacterized protein LOC118181953 n=1 Tax=Stegodyphus dumicola TaxID=202533 RepID=UPI0015A85864|nr:uncharacterized protein LOC118181953 [Stegodyphus dumicola]